MKLEIVDGLFPGTHSRLVSGQTTVAAGDPAAIREIARRVNSFDELVEAATAMSEGYRSYLADDNAVVPATYLNGPFVALTSLLKALKEPRP